MTIKVSTARTACTAWMPCGRSFLNPPFQDKQHACTTAQMPLVTSPPINSACQRYRLQPFLCRLLLPWAPFHWEPPPIKSTLAAPSSSPLSPAPLVTLDPLSITLQASHTHCHKHASQSLTCESQHQLQPLKRTVYTQDMQMQSNPSWLPLPHRAESELPTALECAVSEHEGVAISPRHRQPWDLSLSPSMSPQCPLASADSISYSQSDPGCSGQASTPQTDIWEDQARQEFCCQEILLQQQQLMQGVRRPGQQQKQLLLQLSNQLPHQLPQQASQQPTESAGTPNTWPLAVNSSDGWELDSCKGENLMVEFPPDCHEPEGAWWLNMALDLPLESPVATDQSGSAGEAGDQPTQHAARHFIMVS